MRTSPTAFRTSLVLCLCAAALPHLAFAYLAFPPVYTTPEGKLNCAFTCQTADYFGDGPHVPVNEGNGETSLCYVTPSEKYGNEGMFGTQGDGNVCHVVKPSDPSTRYAVTSDYLCVCQNVDAQGAVDTLWGAHNAQPEGMYAVSQDASWACRIATQAAPAEHEEGHGHVETVYAMGTLQVSIENQAVCSAPVWSGSGSGWQTTSVVLGSQGEGAEVLYAHV